MNNEIARVLPPLSARLPFGECGIEKRSAMTGLLAERLPRHKANLDTWLQNPPRWNYS
jgi:hypothetical protein